VGLSVSWDKDQGAYIPLRHHYLGAPKQISVEQVLNALKPVLENDKIQKVGHNLKFDFSILFRAGIHMKNLFFDTMVAFYCLDPSRSGHDLKDLASEYLGRQLTPIEELIPQKSSRLNRSLPMDQVQIEKVSLYASAEADCTRQLIEKLDPLLKEKRCDSLFYQIEMPLIEILADMELNGIKVDTVFLKKLDDRFSLEIHALESEAYGLAGQEFNLNSSKQLAFILFEKLKLPPARKTKTGFSTDEEVLESLIALHELPRILLKHRELSKLKSTFIDGLLAEVDPGTSRVHTSFNQSGTATGRLSSTNPNLQNIPIRTEQGRMIRRAFIPEKGFVLLSADYSQIDLRVLAHLSGDPVLTEGFNRGADIHRATAAEIYHVRLDQVTDEQRKRAKAINFGIVYGQQAFGLSQSLGISMNDAQNMIESYFHKYAGVREWIEKTKQEAKLKGFVRTLLGRVRYVPEINSKNGSMRSFAERTAINTPVQGTSADIIKAAMIKIYKHLDTQSGRPQVKMLLQVHDDLLLEVPEQHLEKTATSVREDMENAIRLSVPLIADLKTGANWADMEPFKG